MLSAVLQAPSAWSTLFFEADVMAFLRRSDLGESLPEPVNGSKKVLPAKPGHSAHQVNKSRSGRREAGDS